MTQRVALTQVARALACIVMSTPAVAHEFWIDTAPMHTTPKSTMSAHLRVGQDLSGAALPYLDATIETMTLHTPTASRRLTARLGDRPAISDLSLSEPGLHILTVETQPAYIVFDDLKDFEEYLAYEGLAEIGGLHRDRRLPDTDIAEAYIRNARALVKNGPEAEFQADRPTGMPFEIIFEGSPFSGDGRLIVRLNWQGAPMADSQIALFHVPAGMSAPDATVRSVSRTDAAGIADFGSVKPGQYLLNAVRMVPVEGPGDVVWQSHWASLAFHIGSEN